MLNFFWDIHSSAWGPILLISSEKGLVRCSLPSQNPKNILDAFMIQTDGILTHRENSVIKKTKIQLEQYFARKRKNFLISLDLNGTDFQKKVWRELQSIPFGKTLSYKDIATRIGNPAACRAVGSANHFNPIPIVIPCHRVIGKDGSLGGFADGTKECLSLKRKMLNLEKETVSLENNQAFFLDEISPHSTILTKN